MWRVLKSDCFLHWAWRGLRTKLSHSLPRRRLRRGSVQPGGTVKPAQNLPCRPRFTVCLRTNSMTFCHHPKLRFSFIYNDLKDFTREHGVLGGECSNHSVPTIFFNDLAQPNPLGFFMPGEITPTFTPTDFFRRRELCAGLSTRQDFSSRERKYAICVLFVFVEHF